MVESISAIRNTTSAKTNGDGNLKSKSGVLNRSYTTSTTSTNQTFLGSNQTTTNPPDSVPQTLATYFGPTKMTSVYGHMEVAIDFGLGNSYSATASVFAKGGGVTASKLTGFAISGSQVSFNLERSGAISTSASGTGEGRIDATGNPTAVSKMHAQVKVYGTTTTMVKTTKTATTSVV